MRSVQYLTMDINKKTQQTITANVGEVGSRFVKIKLMDNDKPMDLTGVNAYIYALKSDNTKIFNAVEIEDAKNGTILAEITSQLLVTVGSIKLTLVLLEGSNKLGSKEFTLNVDDSMLNDEVVESTNEFSALTRALGSVQNIDNRFTKVDEQFISITKDYNNKINEVATTGTTSVVVQNKVEEMAEQGLIQAYTLGDNTVEPRKTTFMETVNISTNLFNYQSVVLGKYLSASSGEERISSDYLYSDFIEVKNGQNVSFTECYNTIVTYYNANKVFTKGESIGNCPSGKTLNISEDGYIKISLRYLNVSIATNYDYTKFAICIGDSATYEPFELKTKLKDEYMQDIITDIENIKNNKSSKFYTFVSKKNGDFTSITEAVKIAENGDTIIVDSGIYENEIIEAWGKTLYIIGVSKKDCIIKNSTGAYHTPPIEASSGLFKNLSIIHEKNGTTTGVDGYAIHIEDNDLANKNLVFENCYIESQNNWAIGMGMRGGCYVEFNKCDLVGNDNKHGGLFFHDSAIDEYLGVQTIRCIDTNIYSIGDNTTDLKIQSQNKVGSTVNVEFIRTNVRNLTNGKQTKAFLNDNNGSYTNASTINELTNFNLSKASFGNSFSTLNYV